MKISRHILANLQQVYSLALIRSGKAGQQPIVAAGSEGDAELLLFEPPSYSPRIIACRPGGFMSLCSFENNGRRYLLASTDFKPGFKGENCRIVLYGIDDLEICVPNEVAFLPYTHRIAVGEVAGRQCLFASTLCSSKDYKQDWSHPGAIYLGVIPDQPCRKWQLQSMVSGLSKNHGFEAACLYRGTSGGFLVSAMEGLLYIPIPAELDAPWKSEVIADGEHSDAFAFDWDGSGTPQIFAISPFHGDALSMFHKTNEQWRRTIIDEDIGSGHVLWAGRLLGEMVLIVGGRSGGKTLSFYRPAKPPETGITKEIIDEGIGPTQMVVVDRGNDGASLFVAGHAVNKVLMYDITP